MPTTADYEREARLWSTILRDAQHSGCLCFDHIRVIEKAKEEIDRCRQAIIDLDAEASIDPNQPPESYG